MDKIIIIDDDKELRLLMKKCMEQETYTAEEVPKVYG